MNDLNLIFCDCDFVFENFNSYSRVLTKNFFSPAKSHFKTILYSFLPFNHYLPPNQHWLFSLNHITF